MALIERLPAVDAASAAARALEQLLGHDVILTVGDPAYATPSSDVLPGGDTRAVALPFGNGAAGEVSLIVGEQFGASIEAAAPDASLVSGVLPALEAAAATTEPVIELQAISDYAGEIATDTLLTSVTGAFVAVPILENDERVACVVVRVVDDEPELPADPAMVTDHTPAPEPMATAPAVPVPVPPAAAPGTPASGIVVHEFVPLGDGGAATGPARPLHLLNDVQMEVIAELGRRRLKVRDLVELRPGSVIELDRAAGSPVDLLVNGALLAHGEVVVIDEEYGIRVSEIVVGDG